MGSGIGPGQGRDDGLFPLLPDPKARTGATSRGIAWGCFRDFCRAPWRCRRSALFLRIKPAQRRGQFAHHAVRAVERPHLAAEIIRQHFFDQARPKAFLSGLVTAGPPLSVQLKLKVSEPPTGRSDHATATLPWPDSAPYLVALVASSWIATASASACLAVRCRSGPLTLILDAMLQFERQYRLAFDGLFQLGDRAPFLGDVAGDRQQMRRLAVGAHDRGDLHIPGGAGCPWRYWRGP